MGLRDDLRERWDERVREHDLPSAAYAAVGLADLVEARVRGWMGSARTAYPDLAARGDRRLSHDSAETQVRQRMAEFTDRVAPTVARMQVRSQERVRQVREGETPPTTSPRGRGSTSRGGSTAPPDARPRRTGGSDE